MLTYITPPPPTPFRALLPPLFPDLWYGYGVVIFSLTVTVPPPPPTRPPTRHSLPIPLPARTSPEAPARRDGPSVSLPRTTHPIPGKLDE